MGMEMYQIFRTQVDGCAPLLYQDRLLESWSWSWLSRLPGVSTFGQASLQWLMLRRLLTPGQVLRHKNYFSPPPLSVEQARLQLRLPAQVDLEGGALVAGGEAGDGNAEQAARFEDSSAVGQGRECVFATG